MAELEKEIANMESAINSPLDSEHWSNLQKIQQRERDMLESIKALLGHIKGG